MIIYAITNPITEQIIYIGQTCNLKQRIISHTYSHNGFLRDEIKTITNAGLSPVFSVVEECEPEITNERERFWIKKHFDDGCPLHNGVAYPQREKITTTLKSIRLWDSLLENVNESGKIKYLTLSQYINSLIAKDLDIK